MNFVENVFSGVVVNLTLRLGNLDVSVAFWVFDRYEKPATVVPDRDAAAVEDAFFGVK